MSPNRQRARNTQSVRYKTYGTSTHSDRQARPQIAHSNSHGQNVVETKKPKPNVFIVPSGVVGEVGLATSTQIPRVAQNCLEDRDSPKSELGRATRD